MRRRFGKSLAPLFIARPRNRGRKSRSMKTLEYGRFHNQDSSCSDPRRYFTSPGSVRAAACVSIFIFPIMVINITSFSYWRRFFDKGIRPLGFPSRVSTKPVTNCTPTKLTPNARGVMRQDLLSDWYITTTQHNTSTVG